MGNEYPNDCEGKVQSCSFSVVGDQHQNSRAERAVQTIMYMARTCMIQLSLHWKENGVDDISFWSFEVKHYV